MASLFRSSSKNQKEVGRSTARMQTTLRQESKTANLLVAAAAAHVAVHIRGNAAVELHNDEVTLAY